MGPVFIFAFFVLLILSIWKRWRLNAQRSKSWDALAESKASPLSRAVAGLVGTAGGIYLSLVLLATFLNLNVPARVRLGEIYLEPIAAISIALAIIQPFILNYFPLKRRF
jgi:hypothetical protein